MQLVDISKFKVLHPCWVMHDEHSSALHLKDLYHGFFLLYAGIKFAKLTTGNSHDWHFKNAS